MPRATTRGIRRFRAGAALATSTLVAVALLGVPPAGGQSGTPPPVVRIGALLSITGGGSSLGNTSRAALETATSGTSGSRLRTGAPAWSWTSSTPARIRRGPRLGSPSSPTKGSGSSSARSRAPRSRPSSPSPTPAGCSSSPRAAPRRRWRRPTTTCSVSCPPTTSRDGPPSTSSNGRAPESWSRCGATTEATRASPTRCGPPRRPTASSCRPGCGTSPRRPTSGPRSPSWAAR